MVASKNRILIYAPHNFNLESGQQILISIKLQLEVLCNHLLFLTSLSNLSLNKPLICPGISDSTSHELVLLIRNLYKLSISIKKGQQLAVSFITSLKKIQSIHTIGDTINLGLQEPIEEETQELDKLQTEFKYIFLTSDQNFGLI